MQNSEEIFSAKSTTFKTEDALISFCLKIRFKQHLDSAPLHFYSDSLQLFQLKPSIACIKT